MALYELKNSNGMKVVISDLGGTIRELHVPDADGSTRDVVLCPPEKAANPACMGTLIGRCAGRIAGAQFMLYGHMYSLTKNDGANHLHGGVHGFDTQYWTAEKRGRSLAMGLISDDGSEGYPGRLTVEVIYTLTDSNDFTVEYFAESDKDTICNLTSHSYFNLDGHDSGRVIGHVLKLHSNTALRAENDLTAQGDLFPVRGTPFDFTAAKAIGRDMAAQHPMLMSARGYDVSYALDDTAALKTAAELYSPVSGIKLTLSTTERCLQLYTANSLDGHKGKKGAKYDRHCAVCLEAQGYPNSPNVHRFPQSILRKGAKYYQKTVHNFSLL